MGGGSSSSPHETCPGGVDDGELIVRHLSSGGIAIGVELTCDPQPGLGRRCADQVDHHFMTDERFATPVLSNGREQTVFNFVPLAGTRRKVTHRDFQTGFIRQFLQL